MPTRSHWLVTRSRWLRVLLVLAVGALALGLRLRAAERLPIDYDEVFYVPAAQELAEALRSREWAALTETNAYPQHPQLAKLLFAFAILPAPESAPSPTRESMFPNRPKPPEAQLLYARRLAALLGALEALLLAAVQPLAGLFLAVHAFTVKHTSVVMLESLPALTSLAAVASHVRFEQTGRSRWQAASAVLLGLTAAAKYVYAIVGVAILLDRWLDVRATLADVAARVRSSLAWGLGALGVFFATQPYLWPDPIGRLAASVVHLSAYQYGRQVHAAEFGFWQPIEWLTLYLPNDAPELRPYLFRLDPLITGLALFGLDRLWRRERTYVLWLGLGLLFLLYWDTKWPQYVLIVTAPLCLAAAEGTQRIAGWLRRGLRRAA